MKIVHIFTIKKINNNCFLSVCQQNGQLIAKTSLKKKKTQDLKNRITWGIIFLLKKLRNKKIKINFIVLNIQHLEIKLLQQIFIILNTWRISVISFNYFTSTPHNGCRKTHLSRKRKKGLKKNKKQIKGL